MKGYFCPKCRVNHELTSRIGAKHLSCVLTKEDFGKALDFTATAGSYAYITDNSQQYLRDVQVFELLGDKFSKAGHFSGSESVKTWVKQRLSVNPENNDMFYRFFQGHGAGEVDALRHMNGRLSSLLYRAEFPRNAIGNINPSTPGYDFHLVNRFTGEVVEQVQVKANWSSDPAAWKATIEKMLANKEYSPEHTLALPQEVADMAREMGVENKIVVVGDVDGNRISAERLTEMAKRGEIATEGAITIQGIAQQVGQGAVVGAAVYCGISAISNYIAYRRGDMSGKQVFKRIGVDASKGAIIGGAMGGLSLVFPPGAIGIGIGVLIGMQVRRIVDIAYGKGGYENVLRAMGAVEASIQVSSAGIAAISQSTSFARMSQKATVEDVRAFTSISQDTDSMLKRLDEFEKGNSDE
jgi:hypothetical protein